MIQLNRSVVAIVLAWVFSMAAAASNDSQGRSLNSAIRSDACNGSCVDVLAAGQSSILRVRQPATGAVFKAIPLDASIGDVQSSRSTLGGTFLKDADAATHSASSDSPEDSAPPPPPGGSGIVQEQSPYSDGSGSGYIVVTYVFSDFQLVDVSVVKYPIPHMPGVD